MGSCWNCGIEVTLSEDNTKCPSCKKTLFYKCWSCLKTFEVSNEQGKKRKECPVCKFFYCPSCGICGNNCNKRAWEIYLKSKKLPEDIKAIIEYFGKEKVGAEEKRCPREVGISYGKGKIKTCLLKMKGYGTKNMEDSKKFLERFDEIVNNIPLGESTTITKIRGEGTYGQEYRDVFNMGICLGLFKIERKPNPDKTGVDIQMFTRVNDSPCKYWDVENITFKKCTNPSCKIINHPIEGTYCSSCLYKKGDKKGQPYKLKLCKSDKDTCQYERKDYLKIKEEDEKDGDFEAED